MTNTLFNQILLLTLSALLVACDPSGTSSSEAVKGEQGTDAQGVAAVFEKGPHGGVLLKDRDLVLELAIFETGRPPEFRAWPTVDGKPVALANVHVRVTLERLGGVTDEITFTPHSEADDNFLVGATEIYEPHSFTVSVAAQVGGATHQWRYDSFEGRTAIPAATALAAGVVVDVAGPRVIQDILPLYGRIAPNPETVSEVTARYPGVIRSLTPSVGDSVKRGAVLAVVESDESLRSYNIASPISGVVTMRHANPGEQTDGKPLFTVSNLQSVWAEVSVFPQDAARLKPGQRARIRSVDGGEFADGEVVRVNPAGAGSGQGLRAYIGLDNADGRWTPGLFVNAEVVVGGREVPIAVRQNAIQRMRDWQVAFENVGDQFEARPLELGDSDGTWVEVKSGLRPGARYVAANSFVIKADIEKSGASHDH